MHIEEINLTKDNLIKIKQIDDTFYKKDNITLEWLLERYKDTHKGLLLFNQDKVVGYIVAVPIKKELYDTIVNGVITNDLQVNPNMFVDESDYYYIVSCVILKEYRGKGYGNKMLKLILENKEKNYCALTISEDGYNLVKNHMDLRTKVCKNIYVFEKALIKINREV